MTCVTTTPYSSARPQAPDSTELNRFQQLVLGVLRLCEVRQLAKTPAGGGQFCSRASRQVLGTIAALWTEYCDANQVSEQERVRWGPTAVEYLTNAEDLEFPVWQPADKDKTADTAHVTTTERIESKVVVVVDDATMTPDRAPIRDYSIFVHAPCSDGILSAAIGVLANPRNRWHLLAHPVPSFTEKMCEEDPRIRGQHVLFIDTAPRSVKCLRALYKFAASVRVLDHHQTTADTFADFLDSSIGHHRGQGTGSIETCVHVSSTRSGAGLAWVFFFGDRTPLPTIVEYVEDRDLHRDKLYLARDITTTLYDLALDSVDPHIDFLKRGQLSEVELRQLAERGRNIRLERAKMAAGAVRKATFHRETINGISYLIGYVDVSAHVRDHAAALVLNELSGSVPSLDICALSVYDESLNQSSFSLRPGMLCPRLDVAKVAKELGECKLAISGGGHPFAAGVQRAGYQRTLTMSDLQRADLVAAAESKSGET